MSAAFLFVCKEIRDLVHIFHQSKSVLCPRTFLIPHILVKLAALDVMEVEHLKRFKWRLIISLGNENIELC